MWMSLQFSNSPWLWRCNSFQVSLLPLWQSFPYPLFYPCLFWYSRGSALVLFYSTAFLAFLPINFQLLFTYWWPHIHVSSPADPGMALDSGRKHHMTRRPCIAYAAYPASDTPHTHFVAMPLYPSRSTENSDVTLESFPKTSPQS